MIKSSIDKLFDKEILKQKNFSDILKCTSHFYPNNIFIVENENFFSFKEFDELVDQCCEYFLELNLKAKSVVTLLLPNSIEFIILYFACIRYGLIVSPIPSSSNMNNIKHSIKLSKSKIIYSEKKIYFKKKIQNIVIKDLSFFLKKLKKFEIKKFDKKIIPNSTAVYYFSSGTTSLPKLIKYSHYAMVQCQKLLNKSNFLPKFSNHMSFLPLGHTASMRYSIKNAIVNVGTVFLYKNYWSIKDYLWKEIKKKNINFIGVVPTILQAIYINSSRIKKIRSLKFFGCGSSILSKELQIKFEKKFQTKISNIYGMSEIGVASLDNPNSKKRKIGSIGESLKGVTIKLFKNKNKVVSDNTIGEIGIKTPAIFSGYIPNKKINFLKNKGYFMSGDLAVKKDKHFFFIDRSKDLIIKGGVNISPQEIDDCLNSNNKVFESASISKQDNFFGEDIKSYVVLKNGYKAKKDELMNFCKKKIGQYKTPSQIVFVKQLPKTASGKILKRLLKD